MDAQLLNQTWQENLRRWSAGEPERLEIELRDLHCAKHQAEVKLQKIQKRITRVENRLREIGS